MNKKIYLGREEANFTQTNVSGREVTIEGETYYKITNVNAMRPFFMSIVSDSNHWMFISSLGSLSAGRKNSNFALFPYYTDDKITESYETTGSKSIFIVSKDNNDYLWEPFSDRHSGIYQITRNLYKNSYGNKVIFEEINHDLALRYTYSWKSSHKYGFIRESILENQNETEVKVNLLDGVQNLLPYGVEEALQNSSSNLVDAYKKCELETDTSLGIYSLSAIIVDKAEPSEALKANIVWSTGLEGAKTLICSRQLEAFRQGQAIEQEIDIKAEKGAYFRSKSVVLKSKAKESWRLIANVNQTISAIIGLKEELLKHDMNTLIDEDIQLGSQRLNQLVGAADGLQLTADRLGNIRHFANTMFNIMRGGIFDDNYRIEKADFVQYIYKANHKVYVIKTAELDGLPEVFTLSDLKAIAQKDDNQNFIRLCYEYLPLKFSRRHGDPSRPWNKFSINTQNEIDGSKVLDYQGNWRDIFQNWEALAHSYPEFIEGMIHKFLNATTFDGYNPYRVTKDGFDWETIEPDNPWSYIGYWGDHQIIYLLKFLEFSEAHYPGKLDQYFNQDLFVYANVPYRIKSYEAMLKDPKNTIDFDWENEEKIQLKRKEIGVDGALLRDENIFIHKVNFIEKILATVLAKIANLIPEGGIWMNTQRPEWNDANNALVGNGVSMVTLYYLRRFLKFTHKLVDKSQDTAFELSVELSQFFNAINTTLDSHKEELSQGINNFKRKSIMDGLGRAASEYRNTIYDKSFSGKKQHLTKVELLQFIALALDYLDQSIDKNKRQDGLYHAYNLMELKNEKEVEISYLPEMLEGQVAVLSSGYLSTSESVAVLDSLKASALFREDQYSYILYPNKTLSRFVDKNTIPKEKAEKSKLLQTLVADGNRQILTKDCRGAYHFNGNFNNVNHLISALADLPEQYREQAEHEKEGICALYETVFDHKSFTGRSGTFFGYEGLGSIYWHMVSKLLLATYEVTQKALDAHEDQGLIGRLYDHYFEINAGIGAHKSPELYGAFPTDPYSHTPGGKGAQQPGMTGQVKEDIISRFGELGLRVEDGKLRFDVQILRDSEFLSQAQTFNYIDVKGKEQSINIAQGSLAFTYCQVPVVYSKNGTVGLDLHLSSGEIVAFDTLEIDSENTQQLFGRTNHIEKIMVSISKKA
ncbi:MAG: hypothetical protein ACPH03_01400 [Flavobacteriaceae bacterium]